MLKTVFTGEVLHALRLEHGMLIAYCEEKDDVRMTVAFKMVSFDTGKITNVAKNIYQLSKFGSNYKAFCMQVDNYITCKVLPFHNGKMLIVERDGSAKLLNTDASALWIGSLCYKGLAPSGIDIYENKLWACFPSENVLVRYNLSTMHEELRIGGGKNSPFSSPVDLFIRDRFAFVCNPGTMQLLRVDLETFALNVEEEFTTPVRQYFEADGYRFIVNDDGVFMLS